MRKPLLSAIVATIIAAALIGYLYVGRRLRQSVARTSGTITLKGLRDKVTIRRDKLGVPYIEASNEDDLFFAVGYVWASERLWQMETMKMAMQGRLAELAGPGMLGIDIFMRSLGFKQVVEKQLPTLNKETRAIVESYCRGVNAYLDSDPSLPLEFMLTGHKPERWTPASSGYVFGMLVFQLSFNYFEELTYLKLAHKVGHDKAAYLFPVYPDEDLPFDEAKKLGSLPHGDLTAGLIGWRDIRNKLGALVQGFPASNNWALAGWRAKSGKSIIANDTHILILAPSIWMLMHLKSPTYEAAGAVAPGTPPVAVGYNGNLAWGVTMVMADHQDIFVEKLQEKDGKLYYLYQDQWLPTEVRREKFSVKWGKPVWVDIHSTRHGPLLNTALERQESKSVIPQQPPRINSRYGLALSIALPERTDTPLGFYRLGKAKNITQAREAISLVKQMHLNFMFGDRDNIAWQVSGYYPLRKKGRGLLPSPGWNGEYDWDGYLPFDKYPYSINPADGFLATSNNRTVGRDYPYVLSSSWEKPERVERVRQVLGAARDATIEDMRNLQNDRYSLMAYKVQAMLSAGPLAEKIRRVIESWNSADTRARALEALDMLSKKRFDCVIRAESAPAAVLGTFIYAFVRETFLDELGPEGGEDWSLFLEMCAENYSALQDHLLYREDSPFWENINTPQKETKADILALSLARAIELCEAAMGKERASWQWGKLHAYKWRNELTRTVPLLLDGLNRGPYPAGGDFSTVNVSGYYWGRDYDVFLIPILRMIVDFGLEEPAFMMTVPGQSGNPASPHYDDLIPYFLQGKLHPMPFKSEAVKAQYRDVLILQPR